MADKEILRVVCKESCGLAVTTKLLLHHLNLCLVLFLEL